MSDTPSEETPTTALCDYCRRPTPVGRETCAHCGTAQGWNQIGPREPMPGEESLLGCLVVPVAAAGAALLMGLLLGMLYKGLPKLMTTPWGLLLLLALAAWLLRRQRRRPSQGQDPPGLAQSSVVEDSEKQ